jgi:leucyl aminopeptidase
MSWKAPKLPEIAYLPKETNLWAGLGLQHGIILLEEGDQKKDFAAKDALFKALARKASDFSKLASDPLVVDFEGALLSFVLLSQESSFERRAVLAKACAPILVEHPKQLAISSVSCLPEVFFEDALYTVLVNGVTLPSRKKETSQVLDKVLIAEGYAPDFARACALGNLFVRSIVSLPSNESDTQAMREIVAQVAEEKGWELEVFDEKRLQELGAGAFLAVAKGAHNPYSAIVRLGYRKGEKKRFALVGKGICFDTGGYNLKTAKYMQHMHEDKTGAAVVLGILAAMDELGWPFAVDGWLALTQNEISADAYRPQDVVKAMDGTSIEVIHTDAEGRMVLADTLVLAAQQKPEFIIDYATLTGACMVALGAQYSGLFSNDLTMAQTFMDEAKKAGERLWLFPYDKDYDKLLESRIADIKQCTLEGGADHILAARFLGRFVGAIPWAHVDLSASRSEGGLGAVTDEVTGFGVAATLAFLKSAV